MTFGQFFSANLLTFLMLFAAIGFLAKIEIENYKNRTPTVSPQGLSILINSGAMLIDLRNAKDFKKGHIAGAKNYTVEALAHVKSKEVILYDVDGFNTQPAVTALQNQGVKVTVLDGGLNAWINENFPLVKQ